MILARQIMMKHKNFFYMINNCIFFSSGYYSHPRTYYSHPKIYFVLLFIIQIPETKMISMATQHDFLPNRILQSNLAKSKDDLLETPEQI